MFFKLMRKLSDDVIGVYARIYDFFKKPTIEQIEARDFEKRRQVAVEGYLKKANQIKNLSTDEFNVLTAKTETVDNLISASHALKAEMLKLKLKQTSDNTSVVVMALLEKANELTSKIVVTIGLDLNKLENFASVARLTVELDILRAKIAFMQDQINHGYELPTDENALLVAAQKWLDEKKAAQAKEDQSNTKFEVVADFTVEETDNSVEFVEDPSLGMKVLSWAWKTCSLGNKAEPVAKAPWKMPVGELLENDEYDSRYDSGYRF